MARTILSRVAWSVLTLLVAITAIFILVRLAPGGPLDGERILPDAVKHELEARWRLDLPLHAQYVHFLGDLIRFDLGPSYRHQGRTVQSLIIEGLSTTLALGGSAMACAILLGLGFGIIAAVRHNRATDYSIMAVAMLGVAIPEFVIGPVLVLVFAMWLGWVPAQGWGTAAHYALPVATLTVYYTAVISRITRGKMLEVLRLDYIRTARAKGVSEWRVVFHHALRGGVTATVTYVGVATAGILTGGALVVEKIFNIPGIAKYFLDAAVSFNYPLVMGTSITFLVMLISLNLAVDVVYVILDPRQRR